MPKSEPLEYYIHDGSAALRFELSGRLSGRGAESLYHAWKTALSVIGCRPLILDITRLSGADDRGRELLRVWRQHGATIIAASRLSGALVESISVERDASLLDRIADFATANINAIKLARAPDSR